MNVRDIEVIADKIIDELGLSQLFHTEYTWGSDWEEVNITVEYCSRSVLFYQGTLYGDTEEEIRDEILKILSEVKPMIKELIDDLSIYL